MGNTLMNENDQDAESLPFRPIAVGAFYPGIERGLSADLIAARALDGQAYPVCTSLVVAGGGVVTDVLDVPTDSVDAQLEHLFGTRTPTAAKVSIVNHPATVEIVFSHLKDQLDGPLVFDMTLSGPSGEDIVNQRGIEALNEHLEQPNLVTLRVQDAALIAGMEIPSLDDAQVAVQRLGKLGAQRVLLRCGRLPTHFFDTDSEPPNYAVDLYYDGDDFALFEAPHVPAENTHGASSAYLMSVLKALCADEPMPEALQSAKAYVTEALRHGQEHESIDAPHYFWRWAKETSLS